MKDYGYKFNENPQAPLTLARCVALYEMGIATEFKNGKCETMVIEN